MRKWDETDKYCRNVVHMALEACKETKIIY